MSQWMREIAMRGLLHAPDRGSAGMINPFDETDVLSEPERFDALMSLALDDMLTLEEELEFASMLAEDSSRGEAWSDWQAFDHAFRTTPSVEPPNNFVAAFEESLVKRERRHRLWLGFGVAAIAVLLWIGLVAGFAGASAYVMFRQAEWLTAVVRVVAQWGAAIETQAAAVASMLTAALLTPQMQLLAIAYVALAGLALWFWARFLQRSVVEPQATAATIS